MQGRVIFRKERKRDSEREKWGLTGRLVRTWEIVGTTKTAPEDFVVREIGGFSRVCVGAGAASASGSGAAGGGEHPPPRRPPYRGSPT